MTKKTYSCTLTRWHKVTERLTKEYSALTKAAKSGLAETTVTEYLGEAQEARLIELRDTCLKQIDNALAVQETIVQIRQALGTTNENQGVSRALADYDKLVKRVNLFESLLSARTSEQVAISELKAVKNPGRSEKYLERGQPKIAVAMLEGEPLERLQAQFSEATTAMYAQADRLADLNKWVLEIALEPEIAKLAGL
ncbi:MAG: hypothetical protein JZU60_03015 [Ilumatobacteraceae bacterium]|jgi:hypothetical protein|nr:hypothetical protein [Ilumatobacteraceae bacterium]